MNEQLNKRLRVKNETERIYLGLTDKEYNERSQRAINITDNLHTYVSESVKSLRLLSDLNKQMNEL